MRKTSASDHIWTVIELIKWGTEYFKAKDIDSPRLTMELMLCDVLEESRIKLYTDFERPLLKEELQSLKAMIERRVKHEPLQYILGEADFYSLKFKVDRNVLIPRQETELLVDRVIRWCEHSGKRTLRCLDVGTGSGCIAISIARHVAYSKWTCIDDQSGALKIAAENAAHLDTNQQCEFGQMDFRSQVPGGQFDLITMNPPYIAVDEISQLEKEVRDYEPLNALTDDADGLHFYRRMADVAPQLLARDGALFMEIGFGQARSVVELFDEAGYTTEVFSDLSGIERIVHVANTSVMMS